MVRVLAPDVMINWALPAIAVDKLSVQLSWTPLELPVQLAVYVLPPCTNFTVVEQEAGFALQGRLVPVIVKAKLLGEPLPRLRSSGVIVAIRGKLDEVVSIKRTFCK